MTAILYVKNRGLYADTRHVNMPEDNSGLTEITHCPKIIKANNNQFAYAITGELVNSEQRLDELENVLFEIVEDMTNNGMAIAYCKEILDDLYKSSKICIYGTIIVLTRHICLTIDSTSGYTQNITDKKYQGFGYDTAKLEAAMRVFKKPEIAMLTIKLYSSVSGYIDKPDCCLMTDLEPISLEEKTNVIMGK